MQMTTQFDAKKYQSLVYQANAMNFCFLQWKSYSPWIQATAPGFWNSVDWRLVFMD